MRDANLIPDLVRAGLDAELVGRVVSELENVRDMSGTDVRDIIRIYETSRKRNQRKSGRKQTMSAPIEPKIVPENVPDSVAPSLLTSSLSSSVLGEVLATKQGSKREVVARRDRGTRLPDDWNLSPANTALALEHGHVPTEFETEFKDFWVAVPGARGRKCDWEATARNRIKATSKRRRNGNGHGAPRPGSREDRAERTALAMEKLRNFANGHDPDEPGAGGQAGEPSFGGLPFAKPA